MAEDAREILAEQARLIRHSLGRRSLGGRSSGKPFWVPPENYHVTLKFLGATDEAKIPELVEAVRKASAGFSPFRITYSGWGTFGGRSKILWIGVNCEDTRLQMLAAGVEREVEEPGLARETREFTPHVTIAKQLNGGVADGLVGVPGATQLVSDVVLFESLAGPRYEELARISLSGASET